MIGKSIANLSLKLNTSSAFAIHGREQSHRKNCTKSAKGEGNLGIQLSQWNKWHHCTMQVRFTEWAVGGEIPKCQIYIKMYWLLRGLILSWANRYCEGQEPVDGKRWAIVITRPSRNWSYVWSTARCLSRRPSGCGNYTAAGTPLVYIWCLLSALSRSRLLFTISDCCFGTPRFILNQGFARRRYHLNELRK